MQVVSTATGLRLTFLTHLSPLESLAAGPWSDRATRLKSRPGPQHSSYYKAVGLVSSCSGRLRPARTTSSLAEMPWMDDTQISRHPHARVRGHPGPVKEACIEANGSGGRHRQGSFCDLSVYTAKFRIPMPRTWSRLEIELNGMVRHVEFQLHAAN